LKQGVALTGRNHTGPLCTVGHLTAHSPGPSAADRPCTQQRYRWQTTTTDDDDRHQKAKQYWPIRWPV